MLGSCSDHGRIGPALEMTFHLFLEIFFEILQCHFSWQAQYLVRLDRDTCCSALEMRFHMCRVKQSQVESSRVKQSQVE